MPKKKIVKHGTKVTTAQPDSSIPTMKVTFGLLYKYKTNKQEAEHNM